MGKMSNLAKLKIAFIILHYNAFDETVACVESIKERIDTENYKILIVDNGSVNDSGKILDELYEKDNNVIVYINENNMGFANGLNVGISYIRTHFNVKYVFLLNNDTELVSENCVEVLDQKYNEYKFHILGPDIIDISGKYHINPVERQFRTIEELKQIIKNRKFLYFLNRIYIYPLYYFVKCGVKKLLKKNAVVRYSKEDQLDVQLQGSAIVLSEDYFRYMEGLYSGTFLYFEEAILRYFADKFSMTVLYTPKLIIKHKEGVATRYSANTFRKKQLFFYKNSIRSCETFLRYLQSEEAKKNG